MAQPAAEQYRADIDGLRAIAVIGVVIFHAGIGLLPGGFTGVDVFFVISGFLISRLLWREYRATGTINFVEFWSRRLRRLLPMAALVIVATMVYLILSGRYGALEEAAKDALAGLLYVTNIRENLRGIDYFATEDEPSLFLHYWSLAVEEQFYLIMSVAFACLIGLRNYVSAARRLPLWSGIAVLLLVGVGSLAYCIVATQQSQPGGFFSTLSRCWQFSVGIYAMIAVESYAGRFAKSRILIALAGLLMICGSYVLIDQSLGYPSYYALVPTLGTAFLLFGGAHSDTMNMNPLCRVLAIAPLRYVGQISYSLYLWHWLSFYVARQSFEGTTVAALIGAVAAFMLAVGSTKYVENPLRFGTWLSQTPRRTPVAALGTLVLVSAGLLVAWSWSSQHHPTFSFGSQTIDAGTVRADRPRIYKGVPSCHLDTPEVEPANCIFGVSTAKKKIVLMGDSHAAHWFPALEEIAVSNGLQLINHTKSGCIPIQLRIGNSVLKREYMECAEWRTRVMAEIKEIRPDALFIAASSLYLGINIDGDDNTRNALEERRRKAVAQTISEFGTTAKNVFVISDTPWFKKHPIDCALTGATASQCGGNTAELIRNSFPWTADTSSWPVNVVLVNMNDAICENDFCVPFDEKGFRFHDRHHLTASYSKSLAQELFRRTLQKITSSPD